MEKQIPLIETELLCVECNLPLNHHTNIQLSNCDSLRRTKQAITKRTIIANVERKKLLETLTKDTKQ